MKRLILSMIDSLPAQTMGRLSDAGQDAPWAQGVHYLVTDAEYRLLSEGRAPLHEMPAHDQCLAIWPAHATSWHRVRLPRVNSTKLQDALRGQLEDHLLGDIDHALLVPWPGLRALEEGWIAATHQPSLQRWLDAAEQAGLDIEQVKPLAWPAEPGHIQVHLCRVPDDAGQLHAWLSDQRGVCRVPALSPLIQSLVTEAPEGTSVTWSASPDAMQDAERLLGHPCQLTSPTDQLLVAAQGRFDWRQFSAARGHRFRRQWRRLAHAWSGPEWRAARWGAWALLVAVIGAIGAQAWQLERAIRAADKRMVDLLQSTFPEVRLVVDAPTQMSQQLANRMARHGVVAPDDLEAGLAALNSVWPDQALPLQSMQFERGVWTLAPPSTFNEAQVATLRAQLQAQQWELSVRPGQWQLRKSSATGTAQSNLGAPQ